MQEQAHVLIVDDYREMRDLVRQLLESEGFRVSTAADGRDMRRIMAGSRVDLLILDLMLPGTDGLALCRELRARSAFPPIVMLTAKGEEPDRVTGLETGADDYLAKPFSGRELMARVRAVLRRTRSGAPAPDGREPDSYRFGDWVLHTARRELESAEGLLVPLSSGEYNLLLAFAQRPRRVLSREQLLELANARAGNVLDRSIDIQVSRLRRKLGDDSRQPRLIKTVWGGGYLFTDSVSSA